MTETSTKGTQLPWSWQSKVPWILTISSFIVLLIIGYFLIQNVNWFKDNVFANLTKDATNLDYQIYAYHMHLSMIKRSVGLFSGFAVMFLGIGVAFYTIKELTTMNVNSTNISGSLVTASPGIIAMVIGAILIILTISSKDDFPPFEPKKDTISYTVDKEPVTR